MSFRRADKLAFAGFLLYPRILHDIRGIYVDVAQSSAQLQRLLQAWNLFARIILHLVDALDPLAYSRPASPSPPSARPMQRN